MRDGFGNLSVVLDDHSPLGELRCVRVGILQILGPLGRDPAGAGEAALASRRTPVPRSRAKSRPCGPPVRRRNGLAWHSRSVGFPNVA